MANENYKYEMAMSYSHKDKVIADKIAKSLKDIFEEKFFKDDICQHEIIVADDMKRTLENIFENSKYSIVLFSKSYMDGKYCPIELEKIIEDLKITGNKFFVIIVDESKFINEDIVYYRLKKLNQLEIKRAINSIINKLIEDSLKKADKEYRLNIKTNFISGNEDNWLKEFDWNILTKQYVKKDGREVKDWRSLWKYIKSNFQIIKSERENKKMIIRLNCHLSIAYKLGQVYGDMTRVSGNRSLVIENSNGPRESEFSFDNKYVNENTDMYKGLDKVVKTGGGTDIVYIVSVKYNQTPDIMKDVEKSLKDINYKKCILFSLYKGIESTRELEDISYFIRENIVHYSGKSNGTTHLFLDTMSPIAFLLGGKSITYGDVCLYEYIPKKEEYIQSLLRSQ